MKKAPPAPPLRPGRLATRLVHAGSGRARFGTVSVPPIKASTLLFDTVEGYERAVRGVGPGPAYARYGTASTQALEQALAQAEGGCGAVVLPSGLAAISVALMAVAGAGRRVLLSDAIYGPTRRFCDQHLRKFGVEPVYFDPRGEHLEALFRPDTAAVFLESPASHSFEIIDVPRIAALAHRHGCRVLLDNTWATPVFSRPLAQGVDIVIHSATKYLSGHSDLLMGALVTADRALHEQLVSAQGDMGLSVGADDCFLALRGLRTLEVRMRRHHESALTVARWLAGRPEVARVLCPALPESPGHALWARDYTGASGLFGVELRAAPAASVARMVQGLRWFGIGASWGGYESLILPVDPRAGRLHPERFDGPVLRIHIGLEDPQDLIDDLERGLARLQEQEEA